MRGVGTNVTIIGGRTALNVDISFCNIRTARGLILKTKSFANCQNCAPI